MNIAQRILALLRDGAVKGADQDYKNILISAVAELKRRQLRKHWSSLPSDTKHHAARKRAINRKSRKVVRHLRNQRRMTFEKQLWLLRKKRPSAVLDALYPERAFSWVLPKGRIASKAGSERALSLQRFSLFEDPNLTLGNLRAIAALEATEANALIHFADSHCLDVTPYMLLAEFWGEMLPIFEGGHMEIPVQKVLVKIGLHEHLKISVRGLTDLSDVWAFPLMRRRARGTSTSSTRQLDAQTREYVGDRFCDALDDWLGRPEISLSLNDAGRGWIKNIFGELLENAERHSDGERRDGAWSVAGFMARRRQNDTDEFSYRCFFGFVSIGDTFSESLKRALPQTAKDITAYVERCRDRGCTVSEETLRTLCAIQDGVTCVAEADANDRGGYGLQEMLDLVSLLGRTTKVDGTPKVTIVSGSSCIMLREPYIIGSRMGGDDAARVLWCNPRNSAMEPPDHEFVFDLAYRLPGTAISVSFTLDPDFLGGKTDG